MQRYEVTIEGIVQGIGFRPFIYNLAHSLLLGGFVKNSPHGVVIEVQGKKESIEKFLQNIENNPLPLCRIDKIRAQEIGLKDEEPFSIIHSDSSALSTTLILPDIQICQACLEDIDNIDSRYYGYFATNCTNCGPRYSIINTLAYDRKNTSMNPFIVCSECQEEYEDVTNRRFHAQPISCPKCGPKLTLYHQNQMVQKDAIQTVAQKIQEGEIVAIKGVGGFHIVCDATNAKTVQRLREYKKRPAKPFALMCKDIGGVKSIANVCKEEEKLLTSSQAPIVILQKRFNGVVADNVAPQIGKIGVMLPYTGVHHLLFKHLQTPIVATSANLSDEPIITTKEGIVKKLAFIEYVLDYNREIVNGVDDSLVQVVDKKVQVLRGGRGYTPLSLKLPLQTDEKILGVGANQKNSVAIIQNDTMVVSPHIGELESVANMEFFVQNIKNFERFYGFVPTKIVCDKHPSYASTIWAKEQNIALQQVQHHQAHLEAIKAEYGLLGSDFVGFVYDGTGYGEDGTIWGGEIFVGGERKQYFKPIKLLGGAKAIKEPKRVALAMLFEKLSLDKVLASEFACVQAFSDAQIKLLHQAYQQDINAPLSSSVGRLFDGIASFANLLQTSSYEGESGLLCEMECRDESSVFEYEIEQNVIEIKIVKYLLSNDFDPTKLPPMLINTLCAITVQIAKQEGKSVLLSGGVFQNATLLQKICKKLQKEGIKYYFNSLIPINDGGISVGQVYKALQE